MEGREALGVWFVKPETQVCGARGQVQVFDREPTQFDLAAAGTHVEAQVQRWETGAPYCFPGRGALQPTLTRRGGRVLLAGDYLGTLYTETAISTGFSAAQDAAGLLATERQQRTVRGLPLTAG